MISKKLDKFFNNYLWMIDPEEYRMFNNASGKVVPTRVANGSISASEYAKRCSEFLDKAEKLLDKETLAEMATMFKTADIDLESDQLNSRWKNYLTLTEVFQYPNGEYNADAFDKEIIQSRNPVDPQPELTDKLDNRSGKEYTGPDAVYMIVGQIKIPASSRPADTYYYSTIKNNWVKDVHEGTQYDSKSDAEEDLWDAENLFVDDYSGETRLGWKYQLAVSIVGRKPRKRDHKNLKTENIMNIYEQLNKIDDNKSLNERLHLKESISADMIETDKGVLEVEDWDFSFIDDGEIMITTELGTGSIELPNFNVEKLNSSLSNLRAPLILKVEALHGNECEFNSVILNNINLKFIKECIKENLYESKTLNRTQEEIETLKEDTPSSSKSTKDLVEAAKQIIADLEGKGFVKSDIDAIGTMIKDTIDSRYPSWVSRKDSHRDRLKKAFPDLNI